MTAAVEKRVIRYDGPARLLTVLVRHLEKHGVQVHWEPIEEPGGGVVVDLIDLPLLVTGPYEEIEAGVRLFNTRFRNARVTIGEAHQDAGYGP